MLVIFHFRFVLAAAALLRRLHYDFVDSDRRRRRVGRLPAVASVPAGRRVRDRSAGADVPHDGARTRQTGAERPDRPVQVVPVRERHRVPDPRHADRAQGQRLFRRLPDPGTRARHRRRRRRVVRPGAAGLANVGLQRDAGEWLAVISLSNV